MTSSKHSNHLNFNNLPQQPRLSTTQPLSVIKSHFLEEEEEALNEYGFHADSYADSLTNRSRPVRLLRLLPYEEELELLP